MKLEKRFVEALIRVRADKDFMDWLTSRLETYRDDAVMQRDETTLRVVQGRAQEVRDVMSLIDRAPDLVNLQRRD